MMAARKRFVWRVAGLALSCIAGFSASDLVAAPDQTGIVHTDAGNVRGLINGDVRRYLGIPYAAPPIGALRWRPPVNARPWVTVLDATKFGGTCAQAQRGVFAAPSQNEDCLYLNIYTPRETNAAARNPVMVWFHGGGLFSGESNDYDGSKLVARGNVIVVTLNYRVGVFGFFSHPALNAEGHPYANYGIMDQQFALKWVQRNISAFGGDPNNVTIFGQSGGGTSVMANLVSPLSKGLFQKAINESGTSIQVVTPAASLDDGVQLANSVGCAGADSAKCMRALSVKQILDHQAPILRHVVVFPAIDGTVITKTALDAFSHGSFNHVPIMTGLVADEQSFFMSELKTHKPALPAEYEALVASFGHQNRDKIAARYPLNKYPSPALAEVAAAQGFKSCTARLLDRAWAKYAPVYAYEFRDQTAPSYFPKFSFPMRAYHTAELQYIFPRFHGGRGTPHALNAAQEKLSDQMVDYWTSFARTGRPAISASPPWKPYDAQTDNYQVLDLSGVSNVGGYGKTYDCELWDAILSF